jgi:hypothetical protein
VVHLRFQKITTGRAPSKKASLRGEPWKVPATIDDPAILEEITEAMKGMGW